MFTHYKDIDIYSRSWGPRARFSPYMLYEISGSQELLKTQESLLKQWQQTALCSSELLQGSDFINRVHKNTFKKECLVDKCYLVTM